MRALLVVEATSAGVGRHVIDLCLGLRQLGHEVRVIWSPERSDEKFRSAMEELVSQGGSEVPISMGRGPSPADVGVISAIRQEIRAWKPNVLHANSSKAGAVGRVAAKREGLPSIYTPHAYVTMAPGLSRKGFLLYKGVERYLARIGTHTICVSQFERTHAIDILKLKPESVSVVPNGISGPVIAERNALRRELGVSESDKVIGWVGRMSDQKNPLLMIHAFAKLSQSAPNTVLAMVGDGELRAASEQIALQSGVSDRVKFLGVQDGPTWMNAFDLFAMSSEYEGYPYVALEAAVAGLPLASTRMGAVDEIYSAGKGGFFAPVGDADALSNAILSGLNATPPYETNTITVEEMVCKVVGVYEQVA